MLNIIYASFACSESYFVNIFSKLKKKSGQAMPKFNRLIMEGFAANEDVKVTGITGIHVLNRKDFGLFSRKETEFQNGVNYVYLPSINIKWIKDFFFILSFFFEALNIVQKKCNNVILTDVLNAPVAFGAYLLSRAKKIPYIVILTDVPEYGGSGKAYTIISNYLIKRADEYVFLTEEMNNKYNSGHRPYIVMEGLVDSNEIFDFSSENDDYEVNHTVDSNRVVMYAGGLNRKFGISELVEGFINAQIGGWELHLYGEGKYKNELVKITQNNKTVKYFGTLLSSEIVSKEKEADLLVNPRPTDEDFTKYSFPSKNMEYMVSGTPVLTTDLPGMPDEYKEYVYIIEDYSSEGIKNKLLDVCMIERRELLQKGREAREFVLKNKNNIVQAKKIIEMIETN